MKFTVLFTLILMLGACNSSQKLLCRSWKVDDLSFGKPGTSSNSQLQSMIKQQLASVKVTFKKDGTYIVNRQDSATIGTWSFSKDKKMIHTITAADASDSKLVVLTRSKLVFENVDSTKHLVFTCSPAITSSK